MAPPHYRQTRITHPEGSATYVQHDDGRRVMVGHKITDIHYLDVGAAQRWVDRVCGAAGPWVTAEELLRTI